MQDTLSIIDANGMPIPYDSLSPELKAEIGKYIPLPKPLHETPAFPIPFFVAFFGMLLLFIVLYRLIVIGKEAKSNKGEPYTDESETNKQEGPREYYIYDGAKLGLNHEEIANILVKYYHYYNHLNQALKQRFIERLECFMRGKNFIIYCQEPFKEMPVLASATAVQLTFGLDDYLLPWFTYIGIHRQEYFAHDSLRVLAGNVEGNTITLAWNHLLQGIKDENDGINVGLHEMAHALYYQHAEVQGERTGKFAGHFEEVMEEGEEVYKLKAVQHLLYSDYAYRNLQEFWAESVEIFFERPEEMQRCHPHIYDTLKDLLQQNPLSRENPLC